MTETATEKEIRLSRRFAARRDDLFSNITSSEAKLFLTISVTGFMATAAKTTLENTISKEISKSKKSYEDIPMQLKDLVLSLEVLLEGCLDVHSKLIAIFSIEELSGVKKTLKEIDFFDIELAVKLIRNRRKKQ